VVVRTAVRGGKSFTLSQGVRGLLARLAGRAVPGVNVVLIVGEALAAAATESREELRQRRAAQQSWSRATRQGCSTDLDEVAALVQRRLDRTRRDVVRQVRAHYRQADHALAAYDRVGSWLRAVVVQSEQLVARCDRLLVERLADAYGLAAVVIERTERVPNARLHVVQAGGRVDDEALHRTLQPLLPFEEVTVTGGGRPRLQEAQG
jgi:hypothetical protein